MSLIFFVIVSLYTIQAVVPIEEVLVQMIPPNAVQLSDNNRVIEKVFEEEFLNSVGANIAERLRNQPEEDEVNDAFTPQLEMIESMSELTPLGNLSLGAMMHATNESAIFSVRNRPHLIIKYHANCEISNGPIHPLLVENWSSDVDARSLIHFVSPPALLPLDRPAKLKEFLMDQPAWYDCMSRNGLVRYMVLEQSEGADEIHESKKPSIPGGVLPVKVIVDRFTNLSWRGDAIQS